MSKRYIQVGECLLQADIYYSSTQGMTSQVPVSTYQSYVRPTAQFEAVSTYSYNEATAIYVAVHALSGRNFEIEQKLLAIKSAGASLAERSVSFGDVTMIRPSI